MNREPQVYFAGKVESVEFFRQIRDSYSSSIEVTSYWIDTPLDQLRLEAGLLSSSLKETHASIEDFGNYWSRNEVDIKRADFVLIYAHDKKEVLRGALVEVGMGIAYGKTIIICGEEENSSFGNWQWHPQVVRYPNIIEAINFMCGQ